MELNRRIVILIAVDITLATLAMPAAVVIGLGKFTSPADLERLGMAQMAIFAVMVVFVSFITEIYQRHRDLGLRAIALRILVSLGISFLAIAPFSYPLPGANNRWRLLFLSLLVFGVLQFLSHVGYRILVKFRGFAKKVLIIGAGPLAEHMGEIIPSTDDNYVLSGYVKCTDEPVFVPQETILETGEGLFEAAKREKADKIVVSLSERRGVFPLRDIMACKLSGIEVVDAPSFYEQMTGKLLLESITPSWFIFSEGFKITHWCRVAKRFTDVVCATIGIILTAPFLPVVALLIKLDSAGPVFFRQKRVGEKERIFTIYKFRTMGVEAEKGTGAVWAQEHDPRVTRLGRFLRKSRIDEIPQLFNVLKGDMSLVGPRPERPEFVEKLKEVIPYYSERHFVKPGATGWAQVRYPYGASIEDALEKLRYDLYYIKNISLAFDMMIILETIKVVLFRRGGR